MFKSIVIFAAIAVALGAAYEPPTCQNCGPYENCPHEFTCKDSQCVRLQPLGWSCANDCEVCKEPYFCKDGACRVKDIHCGGEYSYHEPENCEAGSYCNGHKCIKNAHAGDACGDGCNECVNGLTCNTYSPHPTCH